MGRRVGGKGGETMVGKGGEAVGGEGGATLGGKDEVERRWVAQAHGNLVGLLELQGHINDAVDPRAVSPVRGGGAGGRRRRRRGGAGGPPVPVEGNALADTRRGVERLKGEVEAGGKASKTSWGLGVGKERMDGFMEGVVAGGIVDPSGRMGFYPSQVMGKKKVEGQLEEVLAAQAEADAEAAKLGARAVVPGPPAWETQGGAGKGAAKAAAAGQGKGGRNLGATRRAPPGGEAAVGGSYGDFTCAPSRLTFEDFRVGGTYRRQLVLTNTGVAFNKFKMGEMSPQLRRVLRVEFEVPPMMSPGTTATLRVTFEPKEAEDMEEELSFESMGARFVVPVRCTVERCLPALEAGTVDFGECALAESLQRRLTLRNDGSVDAPFTVVREEGHDPAVFVLSRMAGTARGHMSCSLAFSFHPPGLGEFGEDVSLRFDEELGLPDMPITLRGRGGPVSTSFAEDVVDLHYCLDGRTYCAELVVRNNSSKACKVWVSNAAALAPHLKFGLASAVVQAKSEFKLPYSVKVSKQAAREGPFSAGVSGGEGDDGGGGALVFPVKLKAADQNWTPQCTIRVHVTTPGIVCDSASLDFGSVCRGQGTGVSFTIRNDAAVTHHYGFDAPPRGVAVLPSRFGTLLSGESAQLTCVLDAPVIAPNEFALVCKTLAGAALRLPCSYTGPDKDPLAFLPGNSVQMPPCSPGAAVFKMLRLLNKGTHSVTFQFAHPDPESRVIGVSPAYGVVAPGCGVNVEIAHRPRVPGEVDPVEEPVEAEGNEGEEGEGNEGEDGSGKPDTEAAEPEADVAEPETEVVADDEPAAPVRQFTLGKHSLTCFVKAETAHGERAMPTLHVNVGVCTQNY